MHRYLEKRGGNCLLCLNASYAHAMKTYEFTKVELQFSADCKSVTFSHAEINSVIEKTQIYAKYKEPGDT